MAVNSLPLEKTDPAQETTGRVHGNAGLLFQGQSPFVPDGRDQVRYWHDTSPTAVGDNKYSGDTIVERDADGALVVQHVLLGNGDFLLLL